MSERGLSRTSERERTSIRDHLCIFGFYFYFGAHSISDEVAGFSPLWFPQGKIFVSLVSCDYVVHVILLDNILDHID